MLIETAIETVANEWQLHFMIAPVDGSMGGGIGPNFAASTGRGGESMASVREIAKQAGVSITTVSRVLNNHPNVSADVRESVLSAVNKVRYVAAVGRRSVNNVAFVYTGDRSIESPFDAALLKGISDALEDHPYDLMILDARRARRSDETFSNLFMRKGVRGAILRASSQSRTVCEAIAAEGFPLVVIGERFPGSTIPYIFTESRDSSRDAIAYLLDLGHTRVAICLNIVEDADHADRLAGYRDAMTARGLPVDDSLIWRIPANREGGPQVIKRVTTSVERPTAVYITDPVTCVGAMVEARRAGLAIPRDLSIIGFDDGDLRNTVFPSLTAVCQDASALGRESLLMLETLMSDEKNTEVKPRSLRCWLELHDTTMRPEPST